jgi:glycosyltransferase involved in cell wall biosynthesis
MINGQYLKKWRKMKKNIAIVITRLDLGGAQKVALYIAEHLDPKQYNVHLIAGKGGYLDEVITDPKSQISRKAKVELWPEIVHPINLPADTMAFFRLIDYFKRNHMDIVHTHSSKAGLLARMAAAYAKVPYIIHTVHGFPFHEFQNPVMHFLYVVLERFLAKYTTKLVSVGNDVTAYGLKHGVGTPEQYEMIRAGIDIKSFKSRGQSSKLKGNLKKYGLVAGNYTVGMIGNLKKQKNPEGFVKIAVEALKADPDMQFVFAGGGSGQEDLIELTKHYKISDKVKFLGWIDKPGEFIGSLDLFLLTSLWEGLPCTLAQAFAAAKPAVASDVGGNREFVNGFKAGALYPPFEYNKAAELIMAFKDKKKKYTPDKAGFGEFELKDMMKKYEKLYKASLISKL